MNDLSAHVALFAVALSSVFFHKFLSVHGTINADFHREVTRIEKQLRASLFYNEWSKTGPQRPTRGWDRGYISSSLLWGRRE